MEIYNSFQTSVKKALDEIDPNWPKYNGLIVCGTHSPENVEELIGKIKQARDSNLPFLGICAGFQIMALEYARNGLGIKDATSEEFSKKGTFIVYKLPKLRVGIKKVRWQGKITEESHWHNYAIKPEYFEEWFLISGGNHSSFLSNPYDYDGYEGIVEIARLKENKFFVGVQFHPEYQSSKEKPHPLLLEFLKYAKMAM